MTSRERMIQLLGPVLYLGVIHYTAKTDRDFAEMLALLFVLLLTEIVFAIRALYRDHEN